jgi:hypothetical protein
MHRPKREVQESIEEQTVQRLSAEAHAVAVADVLGRPSPSSPKWSARPG